MNFLNIDFRKMKYKDGYYFYLTFMHGDADSYSTYKYYFEPADVIMATDFVEMLKEIFQVSNNCYAIPEKHLYWLLGEEDYEEKYDDDIVRKISSARIPECLEKYITVEAIKKLGFFIPYDCPEYTDYLATLVKIDGTFVKNGFSYNIEL